MSTASFKENTIVLTEIKISWETVKGAIWRLPPQQQQKALKGAQPPPPSLPFSRAPKPSRVRTNSSRFLPWQRRICATTQDPAEPSLLPSGIRDQSHTLGSQKSWVLLALLIPTPAQPQLPGRAQLPPSPALGSQRYN